MPGTVQLYGTSPGGIGASTQYMHPGQQVVGQPQYVVAQSPYDPRVPTMYNAPAAAKPESG